MSDALFALIDARGRSAGAALRAEAVFRAPVRAAGSERNTVGVAERTAAPRPARGWLRPALLIAVAAAVLVGLVLVAKRNDEPAVDHDPSGLRYLVGDLGGAWEAAQLKDAGIATAPDPYQAQLTLYGTPGDPSAPVIQLAWSDPDGEGALSMGLDSVLIFTSGIQGFTVGDSAAGCGTLPDQSLYCAVLLPEGEVQVRARQVPFEDVKVALQTLRITDGSPRVDPAALPSSVSFVTSGDMNVVSAAASGNPDSAEVSRVDYLGAQGAQMSLVVGWADQQEIAFAAVGNEFQRIPLGDGFAYWVPATGDTGAQLVWVRDGRLFSLRVQGAEIGTALELAASVRPASNAEWFAESERVVPSDGNGAVPATASPDTTSVETIGPDDVGLPAELPPATLAPGAEIVDLPLTQVMDATSPDDADFSVPLPDGTFGTVSIAIVGGTFLLRQEGGGRSGPLSTMADPIVQYLGNDGRSGAYLVTTDASVRQLRVTRSNGERYVVDVVQMPAHPGVFIAVVPLPANTLIHADVIDAAGTVLAAIE